jgi:hypothetical protein
VRKAYYLPRMTAIRGRVGESFGDKSMPRRGESRFTGATDDVML